jgi:hypothetical protein
MPDTIGGTMAFHVTVNTIPVPVTTINVTGPPKGNVAAPTLMERRVPIATPLTVTIF